MMGDPGCISLFGHDPKVHQLLSEHLTGEYRVKTLAIRNVTTAWANFPGIDEDDEALRLWLRPLLTDAGALALLTKTTIDDLVVQAAVKILDNNNAWTVVHGMALLIQGGIDFNFAFVPGEAKGDVFEMSRQVAGEIMPECPAAVIAAIGVILFVLQQRRTLHPVLSFRSSK